MIENEINNQAGYKTICTSDIDKDATVSYAAIHYGLTEEMINTYEHYPPKEEMAKFLSDRNVGFDFKKGKPYDWAKLARRKNDYGIKKYYLASVLSNNLGDIVKADEKMIEDFNVMMWGFPCFVEGTLVLTNKGYKPIEQINCNDYVLTHKNRYKKVVKPMINQTSSIYKVDTMPSESIYVTENHPFYVRKKCIVYDKERKYGRIRIFTSPEWLPVNKMTKEYYVGTAINQESKIPEWNGVIFKWSDNRRDRKSDKLREKFEMDDFWYLIGRYIGDGWIRSDGGIIICSNDNELGQIIEKLDSLYFNYCIDKKSTVNKIHIAFKEIGEYCEQFGRGAANKKITNDILDLPIDKLRAFMEGYIAADGSFVNGVYKISSVSRNLIYGIGQCVAKAYSRPFSIYFTQRAKTCVIEGRTVNQKDSYSINFKLETNVQDKAFFEEGYLWSPINDVKEMEYEGLVYNLEVENDNSYVVQNIIVHNCTDVSVAGNQKGFIDETGNKTRSGMYYEGIRILKEKKPSISIIENVKNLVSKKFKAEFEMILKDLDDAGYNSYYKVLNSKDFGIPQNRERVFVISVRKELDNEEFQFPEGFDNGIRLKDILEKEVDENFYISQDKVERFLTNLNNKDALLYDPCEIVREGKSREYNEFCLTLTARDYKDPRIINENTVKQLGNIVDGDGNWDNPQVGRIYSPEGCSPTLNTCGGGGHEPKILQVGNNEINILGRILPESGKFHQKQEVYNTENISPTIQATSYKEPPKILQVGVDKSINKTSEIDCANCITAREDRGISNRVSEGTAILEILDNSYCLDSNYWKGTTVEQYVKKHRRQLILENNIEIRIRKLTPKETFRLMGFSDESFQSAQDVGVSNSQLYRQSGNSIVTDVLYYILVELYKAMTYLFDNLRLGSFFSGIGAFEFALDRLYEGINSGNFTRPQVEVK